MTKSRAQEIIEQLELNFSESVVTKNDYPGDFNDAVKKLTTDNNVIPMPNAPHQTTVNLGGHTYTVADATHPDAPPNMTSSISSTPEGIQHLIDNNILPAKKPIDSGNAS